MLPNAVPPPQRGRTRFRDYEELVSPLWRLECAEDERSRFEWQSDLRHLGLAVFGRTKATPHICFRPPSQVAEVGLDHIIVYFRQAGWGHLKIGDQESNIAAGDITFIDLSRPMWTVGSHVDAICLGFPRSMLAPLVRDVDGLHGHSLRTGTPLGRLAGAHLNALAAEIGAMGPAEARVAAEVTAALLAVCANGSPASSEPARARARPALLVTIRHHIEQHLADPTIGTDAITRQFGVSRSTLYRLFQPFGGIESYIRRRRLARAYHMLRTPAGRSGDYVYQVAQVWGFASDTAFSHAFRREFSVTPRHVAMGLAREPSPVAPVEKTLELSQYLRDLVFQAP